MTITAEQQRAAWFYTLLGRALKETPDYDVAILAAEAGLEMRPYPDEPLDIYLAANEWQSFKGPRGGQGWRNVRTQEVLYQQERPGGPAGVENAAQKQQRRNAFENTYVRQAQPGESKEDFAERQHLEAEKAKQQPAQQPTQQQQPTPAPQPPPSAEYVGREILGTVKNLVASGQFAKNQTQAVSIAGVRDEVRKKFGDEAANGPLFQQAIMKLVQDGYVYIFGRSTQADADEHERAGGIAQAGPDPTYKRMLTLIQLKEQAHLSIDAFLAHDTFNRHAQGILNRAVEASKEMSRAARRQLEKALSANDPAETAKQIAAFIADYRTKLTELLGATQLAALLAGAREVAVKLPAVPPVPVSAPPTLPPDKAVALVEKMRKLSKMEREQRLYDLPPDQQNYVRLMLAAEGAEPQPFTLPSTTDTAYFPTIEEAVKELSSKNVLTRAAYDNLNAAAKQKAFTVAGVESRDTLQKIMDAMTENVREGADFKEFRKVVIDAVGEGTFMSDAHMEMVHRGTVQSGFSDGQMKVLQHPFVRSGFPYATYESIDDSRRRHDHGQLEKLGIDGTNFYRINDPVFQEFRPPWEWGDRCGWTPATVEFAAEHGIKEAQKWVESGVEPSPPAFVAHPPFHAPPGFQRAVSNAPLSIQLSLRPLDEFTAERAVEESLKPAPPIKPRKHKVERRRVRGKGWKK
jgi:hypothetical protein